MFRSWYCILNFASPSTPSVPSTLPFEFHLGNCRELGIAFEEKLSSRGQTKNIIGFGFYYLATKP